MGALVIDFDKGSERFSYRLTNTGEQILSREQQDIRELFHNLARAQTHDDRSEAVGLTSSTSPGSELAATTMRHARLVAHEVRNSLLPVRHALTKVWRAIDSTNLVAELTAPRDQIEQSIARLYQFVEAAARMSAPVDDLPASFSVLEAIDEARRALPGLSGLQLITLPGTANPRCRGARSRFVLVLLNLMRNAIQAAGPGVALTITVDANNPATTVLSIEDDGPGIPEHLRERLFENGTSSHPDGTGHGLALVREVVERELGGTISHEPGTDGGARFRIGLPSLSEPRG